ncbi:MAG: hypothetical protein V3T22_14025 [Planctomycetota bacterium]
MTRSRVRRLLKSDAFGLVELLEGTRGPVVRRVARGGRIPGTGIVARLLMRRERRALLALEGMRQVPRPVEDAQLAGLPATDGRQPRPGQVLLRSWLSGEPLHRAQRLPLDFFDLLDELVAEMHRRGVCHNDLHKEQNVVVGKDGRPALIDFQLASRHVRPGRVFRSRCRDDLRHVQKHRRRYTRDGRGPAQAGAQHGAGFGTQRTAAARIWRATAKPLYLWITRGLLKTRDGEERRPSSGPWPSWGEAVGPLRAGAREDRT